MVNVLLSGGISMVVSLLGTPFLIRALVRHSYGQFIHDDLAQHHHKRGKPTMGGVVIIGATLAGYLGSHLLLLLISSTGLLDLKPGSVSLGALLVLFLLVGMGCVGYLDDYTKISRERSLGLTSRQKLAAQALITVVFALLPLLVKDDEGRSAASTAVSVIRDTAFDLGAAGPVLGTTWKARVLVSLLTPKGTTLTTPSTPRRAVAMRAWASSTSASVRAPSLRGRSATATTGPFIPGPNSSATVV